MKKNSKILTMIISGILIGGFAITVFANAGSNEDPLVSKSYVDKKISEFLNGSGSSSSSSYISDSQLESIVTDVVARLQFEGQTGLSITTGSSFKPVELRAGQKIYGKEGTELILRSGKAAVTTSGSDGITDITIGRDLANETAVGTDHYLIIPRDDGRGLIALTDSWLLVKGSYDIR